MTKQLTMTPTICTFLLGDVLTQLRLSNAHFPLRVPAHHGYTQQQNADIALHYNDYYYLLVVVV